MEIFRTRRSTPTSEYRAFKKIDGTHSFRTRVPEGFVEYPVRKRRGGRIAYFNFDLAKEMGLISERHANQLNTKLQDVLLDTFSLIIINEWDQKNNRKFPKEDLKPNTYMATRYLQLQHPDKKGLTSGDGRSIWNGEIEHRGTRWDITSCGTGATRLSPATAIEKKFFRSGDSSVCYGCGFAEFSDGIAAAIMSEIFHRNGIATERTLLVIEYPGGTSVNVRAGKNLLRPSHMFLHLKQGHYQNLKAAVDYFIDREQTNQRWPSPPRGKNRYRVMTEHVARDFARAAARFETDYIFVWLDWDGDNVLTDGGIIDYGSVRQFGLFHHEYRYDDVDRLSTNITEQFKKAREIVQTFAQMRDFLITGKKSRLSRFANDPVVRIFETEFYRERDRNLLTRVGFPQDITRQLMTAAPNALREFCKVYRNLERAKSARGQYKVADGIMWDAILCMRDLLREYPIELLAGKVSLSPKDFYSLCWSTYATSKDRTLTPHRVRLASRFEKTYQELVHMGAALAKTSPERLLMRMAVRSARINRYDRITGDAILCVTDELMRDRRGLTGSQWLDLVRLFIATQDMTPKSMRGPLQILNQIEHRKSENALSKLLRVVAENRESI